MSVATFLPLILVCGGGYMLIKLRFFFAIHPLRTLKMLRGTLADKSCRRSLALALAGTLGVGNIVGVAVGIIVGGAGSVFWLLISSIFASVLKYSESLTARDSSASGLGMISSIAASYGKCGKNLSYVYATLCIFLSLFMGAALQTSSVAISTSSVFDISSVLVSVIFSVSVCLVLCFFSESIKKFTSAVIPFTTFVYIVISLLVVLLNVGKIPGVLTDIVSLAFTSSGIVGGSLGFLFSRAVSEGFSRGLLSNEAGAGTSSFANSECETDAVSAGLIGICEVLFDTVILCTLTAFVILCSVPDIKAYSDGAELVVSAFTLTLGNFSSYAVILCIALFALSAVVCWYYYGVKCFKYVFGGGVPLFSILFTSFVALGGALSEWLLIAVSDAVLLCLSVLSVLTVIKSSDRTLRLSELSGLLSVPNSK